MWSIRRSDARGRPYKPPKAMRRLRRLFTEDKKLVACKKEFGREPHDDNELEMFKEFYITEVYNSGRDEI